MFVCLNVFGVVCVYSVYIQYMIWSTSICVKFGVYGVVYIYCVCSIYVVYMHMH